MFEVILLREFGKIVSYLRKKGWVWRQQPWHPHLAETRGGELFTKNIAVR